MKSNILSKSLAGVFYLIGLNVVGHGMTFILNTLIVRTVQTNVFGFASVPLQLLVTTILFLSREAFRNACQRSAENEYPPTAGVSSDVCLLFTVVLFNALRNMESDEWERKLTNLSWMVVPVGIAVTFSTFIFSVLTASPEEVSLENYYIVVLLTGLAAFIEVLSEPLYIFTLRFLLYRPRVVIEGTASFFRCVSTFLLVYCYPSLGALAFSFSWLVYSFIIFSGYYAYFFYSIFNNARLEAQPEERKNMQTGSSDTDRPFPLRSVRELFPRPGTTGSVLPRWFDWNRIILLRQFYWQSIQMYILTEGQKYLLRWTQTLEHIAVFSLVNNLGSLVVRFVFLPVEQVCNSLFSKYSELGPKKTATVLSLILKCLFLIGLLFIAFGPNYSFLLVDIMYTNKFSTTDAPFILSFYCFYVALLAINGTMEAFTRAVSAPEDIKVYNFLLVVFSCLYVGAAVSLIPRFDTIGLILAECLNIALRISYCSYFIHDFFRKNSITLKGKEKEDEHGEYTFFHFSQCFPSVKVLLVFVISFVVTRLSETMFLWEKPSYSAFQAAAHVSTGLGCLLAVFSSVYEFLTDRRFLRDLSSLLQQKGKYE